MALGQHYGTQLLMDDEIEQPEETVSALRAVSSEKIQQVAKRVIGPSTFSIAVVGPTAETAQLQSLIDD